MPSTTARFAHLLPRPFRIAHVAWGILILLGCVALVMMGGGHPPPMVFVPFLVLAGLVGHLLLLLIAWLLHLGRSRMAASQHEPPRWPAELTVIALVLGPLAIMATAVAVGEVARLRTQPLQWVLYVVVAAVHAVAFVTLLLRNTQARFLIAAICIGWALALVLQLREARPGELPIGIALIGGLLAIAIYVVRAQRIRSALR